MLLFFQHHYPLKIQIKFFQEFQWINNSRQYGRQTSLSHFQLLMSSNNDLYLYNTSYLICSMTRIILNNTFIILSALFSLYLVTMLMKYSFSNLTYLTTLSITFFINQIIYSFICNFFVIIF